jgi:hypothetical protein
MGGKIRRRGGYAFHHRLLGGPADPHRPEHNAEIDRSKTLIPEWLPGLA